MKFSVKGYGRQLTQMNRLSEDSKFCLLEMIVSSVREKIICSTLVMLGFFCNLDIKNHWKKVNVLIQNGSVRRAEC